MDVIHVRRAEAQDINKLVDLFDAYRVFYRQPSDKDAAHGFLSERLHKKDSVLLLAETDQQPMGFTQLYPMFSSVKMCRTFVLNDLFVAPDHRKKGVASRLIREAQILTTAEGFGGLSLETEKSNQEGNSLYPQLGFVLDTGHNFYHWTP